MEPEQFKAIKAYLRQLADLMGLKDWTVRLVVGHPDSPDADADIACSYGRKNCAIRLHEDYPYRPAANLRHTLCHELIHAHFAGVEWAYNSIQYEIAPSLFRATWNNIDTTQEIGIDALADIIAPFMPLPNIPFKKRKKAPAPKPDEAQEAA